MPNWVTGKIVDKHVWTEGLFTIRVRVEGVQPFKTGQFLHLALQFDAPESDDDSSDSGDSGDDGAKRINRPYSVASPHGDELEFFIVLVPDGKLTPRLWDLSVGDTVDVSDSGSGRFTLDRSPDAENLWMIATGTGLAPYIAMLRTDEPWERFENVIVVHGVRHAGDLAYTEELNSYALKYPGRFQLIQTLTREKVDGLQYGRIPNLFDNRDIETATGIDCLPFDSTVLLCGNPAMLDSMESILGARGMTRHRSKAPGQIVLERYW